MAATIEPPIATVTICLRLRRIFAKKLLGFYPWPLYLFLRPLRELAARLV